MLVPKHFHFFTGLFFAFVLCTGANGQRISFDHLSVGQGLSQNSVLSITQDSRGFMWLGTEGGLTRYDGIRFRIYKRNDADSTSLSNNIINTLFNDSEQTLWIGTGNGVNIYNPQKDVFEQIRINGSLAGNINFIYEDRKGQIWIGSHNGLHLLTNRRKKQFQSFYASAAGIAGNIVWAVFEDHNGGIWVGTNNGLTKMQWQNGGWQFETFRHEAGRPGSLSTNYITSITEDVQHKLWIGTLGAGVNLYDPATNTFSAYSHKDNDPASLINNMIHRVIFIKNKIWVGTSEGLSIIDPATKNITSYQHDASDKKSLSHNAVFDLFEDARGSVWVGTYYGGANILSNTSFSSFQNNKSNSSLSNNVVAGIAEDRQHNLWIGTNGGGLNYWNRTTGLFTVYKNKLNDPFSLGSNRVKVVYIDKEGNTWVGTHGGGLCVLDRKTNQFKRYLYGEVNASMSIRQFTSLLEDKEDHLWVAGNCPLRVFAKNGTELHQLELSDVVSALPKNIYATVLFQDAANNIWIGGWFSGVYKISGDTVKTIKSSNGKEVNCIGQDLNGNIWMGLGYGGLVKYDHTTEKLVQYGAGQGLSNMNVIGLLTDDKGNIWLSTDNGLVKFSPAKNHFQTYDMSDGLAGNEFNYNSYLKDSKGEMFFGGFNGISRFFPDYIETNKYAAPVVFTGLKLFNSNVAIDDTTQLLKEDISLTNELIFKHDQNIFTIEFALLNFIRPNKNKYAYKLEGVHDEWTEINTPSAMFTNLPAGSYTLLVKGANNDGIWSEPAAMKITVRPPFWKTGWAYLLYALIIATILFFVVRLFYLRALLKRDAELHEIKLNFFTNISHEIRTHLTLIMAPIEKMQKENASDPILAHHLKNAQSNANSLLKLVTELMDFRKAESKHLALHIAKYDLISFLNEVYTSFEELSLKKNISLSFVHDVSAVSIYFDKEQIGKVINNLLSNAFKFTPDGSRICLHVECKSDRVQIHVTDNGKGIAQEYIDKLFTNYFQVNDANSQSTGYGIGLALSKTIVELHKGTLTIESNHATPNQESMTRFTVTLLKGAEHFEETGWLQETSGSGEDIKEEQAELPLAIITGNETEEKQYHVLIAEDNNEVRNVIKDSLHSYKLIECINGVQGLQSALEQIPDLIISDVMMPEMNGFELCHKIKTDERTSHIPVILLTAKSSQTDYISGLNTGADIYLTKPFSTQVLELSVKNLLTAREKMRQKFSKEFILAPQNIIINDIEEQFLSRFIGIIEGSMDDPEFGVELLAKKMAMSLSVLYKKVKALTGMSVNDFAKTIRLKKAAQLLQQKFSVFDVSVMTGFSDRKYFSKEFKKQFGKAPSEFSSEQFYP